jgi:hypothetical protein
LGIFGGAAYLSVLATALFVAWRASRRGDPVLRWFAAGCFACLLAFLGFGVFDAIAPGARGGVFLWLILGLTAALYRACQPLDVGYFGPAA